MGMGDRAGSYGDQVAARIGHPRAVRLKVVCGRCWRRLGSLPWPDPCPDNWGVPSGESELSMWDWIWVTGPRTLPSTDSRVGFRSRFRLVNSGTSTFQLRGECKCGARPIIRLHNVKASIVRDVLTLG